MFETVKMLLKIKTRVEYEAAFCCAFFCLELMVTGAPGSGGQNALLPVEVDRGHASVFVITHPQATVVDPVREILLSCPGVIHSPAQVHFYFKHVHTS